MGGSGEATKNQHSDSPDKWVILSPRGHVAMSGDVFDGHDWETLLVSRGWGSGTLLIILHAQDGPCSTIIWPQLLIAPRLRHPGLDQETSIRALGTLRSAGRFG